MLKQRVITALIGLPGLIYLLAFGAPWVVQAFLILCLGMSVFEMLNMLQPRLDDLQSTFSSSEIRDEAAEKAQARLNAMTEGERRASYMRLSLLFAFLVMGLATAVLLSPSGAGKGIVIAGIMAAIVGGVFATRGIDAEVARAFGFTMALVYGGLPWIAIIDLHSLGPSSRYVFLLLIIVWSGDTGGYFGGRFFGKHKLAPHKSPKKTWEGAISGVLASIAGAHIYNLLTDQAIGSFGFVTLTAALTGIGGQLGDLVESVMKRFAKVKDSGAIFPGHGGFLDRTDALLVGGPVLWLILCLAGGSDSLF